MKVSGYVSIPKYCSLFRIFDYIFLIYASSGSHRHSRLHADNLAWKRWDRNTLSAMLGWVEHPWWVNFGCHSRLAVNNTYILVFSGSNMYIKLKLYYTLCVKLCPWRGTDDIVFIATSRELQVYGRLAGYVESRQVGPAVPFTRSGV